MSQFSVTYDRWTSSSPAKGILHNYFDFKDRSERLMNLTSQDEPPNLSATCLRINISVPYIKNSSRYL